MRELSVPASFTVDEKDNIASVVFEHERDDPDFPIYQRLVDGRWQDVTCAQSAAQIRSAAQGLIALGVQPGDRVAILSATRYEWAILDLAILSRGRADGADLRDLLGRSGALGTAGSGAVLAFAETDAHAAIVSELAGEMPNLRRYLSSTPRAPRRSTNWPRPARRWIPPR